MLILILGCISFWVEIFKKLYQNINIVELFLVWFDFQNLETAEEVRLLWQHIDDVLLAQQLLLEEEKILFDGHGDMAVEALDVVVDQLP
jgi:hypothetical protein